MEILILLITVSVTFYIAYRQGAFKKRKLFLSAGIPTIEDEKIDKEFGKSKKPLWAVLVGIPDMIMDYFIILLPYKIENRGNTPIKNILVQFRYRSDFDCSNLKIIDESPNLSNWINYNIKRGVKGTGNLLLVEYDIPLLTPANPLYFCDIMAVKRTKFADERTDFEKEFLKGSLDEKYILEKLKCSYSSENLKPIHFNTWLLITLSKDMSELTKRTRRILDELHKKNCPPVFGPGLRWVPPFWPFWYSLWFPKCIKKKQIIYMQPGSIHLLEKESSNILMQNLEETETQFARLDWRII